MALLEDRSEADGRPVEKRMTGPSSEAAGIHFGHIANSIFPISDLEHIPHRQRGRPLLNNRVPSRGPLSIYSHL